MTVELLVALALVLANGFFVASEFALALEELVGEIEDEFDARAPIIAGSSTSLR